MFNPIVTLATRNLPEAFYTPRIVNTRHFCGDGTYEETFQFAAVPADGNYMVRQYQRSIFQHEHGKPIISTMLTGLNKADAEDMAMRYYALTQQDCLRRRDDYTDYGRLALKTKNVPPPEKGYCWRIIRPDEHAMTTPPQPPGTGPVA